MKPKVLIVEDDRSQVQMYEIAFELADFKVFNAYNKENTIKIIKSEKPDIVFLDILLGHENGLDILKKIKEDEEVKNTKVIIFSNFKNAETKKRADDLGAYDFWVKNGFLPNEIVEKVKVIIKNS